MEITHVARKMSSLIPRFSIHSPTIISDWMISFGLHIMGEGTNLLILIVIGSVDEVTTGFAERSAQCPLKVNARVRQTY